MSIWNYPPTAKQLVAMTLCFAGGTTMFVVGAHLAYANAAPQRARIKARNNLLREHLRRKYGYENRKYIHAPKSKS